MALYLFGLPSEFGVDVYTTLVIPRVVLHYAFDSSVLLFHIGTGIL